MAERIDTFMSKFARLCGNAMVKDSMIIERAVVDGNAVVACGAAGGSVLITGMARVAGAARCFEYDPFVYELGNKPPFDAGDEPMILTVCDGAATLFPKDMDMSTYDPDKEDEFVFPFDKLKEEYPKLWPLVEKVLVRRVKAEETEGRMDLLAQLGKEDKDDGEVDGEVADEEEED